MNEDLLIFAKTKLIDGLKKCNKDQQFLFKRMYSHDNLDREIEDVVDLMDHEKIDWAMQQVQRTVLKNIDREKFNQVQENDRK